LRWCCCCCTSVVLRGMAACRDITGTRTAGMVRKRAKDHRSSFRTCA
jgi:hypothetical protein